jgi:hypothetical protein
MRLGALATLLLLSFLSAFGQQTGTIRGEVIEKSTKDLLPGVNVFIQGTTIGSSTDINGQFSINNVPAGKHTVVCSFLGFNKETQEVDVLPGRNIEVKFFLVESAQALGEIEVVAQRATASENAVMIEIKEAKQLVSGISRQQISRSQDSDAAKVMQRVPGITIVGNRFVMVRGVAERYNQVLINDLIAPSTEVDRRTFSFDLIQSGSLDRMIINKTASPDMPGDFTGGAIRIYTINYVEDDFTHVNLGTGFRVGTTFGDFRMSKGTGTDLLGFDRSFRPLPSNFPSTRNFTATLPNSIERRDFARSLPNNFNPEQSTAGPDFSFGITLGRNKTYENGSRLISTNSINYSRSYQYYLRDFARYDNWPDRSQPIQRFFSFDDDVYERETTVSAMSNWTYFINSRHNIKFSNLFNQIGEEQTVIRNGVNFFRQDELRRDYLLGYRSRSIYSGQVEGNHELNPENHFRWLVGGSFLGESEPDLRRFRTLRDRDAGDDAPYEMVLPPSSNLFETSRYYGKLREYGVSAAADFTHVLMESSAGKTEVKVGAMADFRFRDFDSRYFSYLYPGFFDQTIRAQLILQPLDQIFSSQNISDQNGFVLQEGTRPIDAYTAGNFLTAGYAMATIPLADFNITAGLRVEHNIQTLDARDDIKDIEVDNPVLSLLPSANVTYSFSKRALIRAAYSRTINRPEFRELAPFLFYDYKLDASRFGNPKLQLATIDNFDLRYEFYPRLGEVISVGAFYKRFTNPIENITVVTTEQPNFTYDNANGATNYGVELEFRKSFKQVFNSIFLGRMSANANVSYIWSEVDLGASATNQDRVRPLQGQSPYILNIGLAYTDNQKKFGVSTYYNIFGDRIYSVGDVNFPTIYELPRHSLDLTITKELTSKVALKAGVRDLFNARYRFVQDSNRDAKITSRDYRAIDPLGDDHTIFSFRRGQLVSISATIKL